MPQQWQSRGREVTCLGGGVRAPVLFALALLTMVNGARAKIVEGSRAPKPWKINGPEKLTIQSRLLPSLNYKYLYTNKSFQTTPQTNTY
jgi:hypothetical protein